MTNENEIHESESSLRVLPNSSTVLVLGILSIFFSCIFFGLFSLAMGIIALVLAQQSKSMYIETPRLYSESSVKNLNSGRTCAVIGVVISGLMIVLGMFAVVFFGLAFLRDIPHCYFP